MFHTCAPIALSVPRRRSRGERPRVVGRWDADLYLGGLRLDCLAAAGRVHAVDRREPRHAAMPVSARPSRSPTHPERLAHGPCTAACCSLHIHVGLQWLQHGGRICFGCSRRNVCLLHRSTTACTNTSYVLLLHEQTTWAQSREDLE